MLKTNQKPIFILLISSMGAQIFTILISPLLTRLYTPEDFGIITLITVGVGIFGPIMALKYDMIIVNTDEEEEVNLLIKLSAIITIILSILFAYIYGSLVFDDNFKTFPKTLLYLFLILLLLTTGLTNIFTSLYNRLSNYSLIGYLSFKKSISSGLIMIIGGLFYPSAIMLSSAHLFAQLYILITQILKMPYNYKTKFILNLKKLFNITLKYKNQPIFNASSALISTTVYSSINIFIGKFYTLTQLGLYSMSYRVLGLPFIVISANIAKVYFDKASKESKLTGSYNKTFLKFLLYLSATVMPIMILIYYISPWAFSTIFGDDWIKAGEYIQMLIPMFAARIISESLTTGFIISNKQNFEFIYQFLLFITQSLIFYLTYKWNIDIENFLIMLSLVYFLFHSLIIIHLSILSKINSKELNSK